MKVKIERIEHIAGIESIMRDTPRRELEAGFGAAVVHIASKVATNTSFPPDTTEIVSDLHCLLAIAPFSYACISRQPGSKFYQWDAVTTFGGLYMNAQTKFYIAEITGSGSYAAYPICAGDAAISLAIRYRETELTLHDLTDRELENIYRRLVRLINEEAD